MPPAVALPGPAVQFGSGRSVPSSPGLGSMIFHSPPPCLLLVLYNLIKATTVEYDHTLSHTYCVGNSARVTITLSGDLVEGIDRVARNRSRFIAEAVQHELARRQRDALLQSLSSPHPEIIELADIGLADWTSDLPSDDGGLVDPRGGTAVRWIEDRGWVKEPT